MTTAATLSCFDALAARGFVLTPWRHQAFCQRTFGEIGEIRRFRRGTVEGLIEHEAPCNELRVIALHNDKRGNGQFVAAIKQLESAARATGVRLSVVQFENLRLAEWFGRRPGWTRANNKEHSEHAIFTP